MVCLVLLLLSHLCLAQDEGPIRDTLYGQVQGSLITDQGRAYEQYLGVPFGAPPVDDMRWQKPVSPESWDGVLKTTEYKPHCVQFVALGYPAIGLSNETSEDCLYLDIYVPGENRVGDDLAVMFFVYGGAFFLGTADMYPGYDLALRGDVIVVAVNYRVGSIGFLSTEDDAALGNYGLWDAQFGLKWVRENIAGFGGNPDSITVFGQSAGGAITSHLMITPTTQGMIQRAIAISGSSTGYFGVGLPGQLSDSTQTLARILNCRRLETSNETVACLRERNSTAVDFWGFAGVIAFQQQLPNWIPRIDGEFVPEHPMEMWKSGAGSDIDFISGYTMHDAAPFVTLNFLGYRPNSTFNLAGTPELLNTTMTFITNQYPGDTGEMIAAAYAQYPLMQDEDVEVRTEETARAATDWWFKTYSTYEASYHSSNSNRNTYMYQFNYDQSFLQHPFDWIQGAHVDDLYSVFGEPFMQVFRDRFLDADFNDEDKLVNEYMSSYYTNFANNGDPNEGLPVPVEWPQFTTDTKDFIDFKVETEILQITDEDAEKYDFWSNEFLDIAIPEEDFHKESRSIEDIPDELFEEELMNGVEIIKSWCYMQFEDHPNELEAMLHFIDSMIELRQNEMDYY